VSFFFFFVYRRCNFMPMAKDVETFLAAYPPEVRDVALAARRLLGGALPGATETLDDSARIIGYSYQPDTRVLSAR
jgi:hypothetical protein